ncbi:MAG: wax ester/triacylglycerol synthase family O-acyltransferase [Candidatus Dormibacteraeota bacterium]|nr:wax ester/triacylglycerol synthase family O-acyltransferase [Candidatus Dormibacteraeota bacterium]
MSRADAAWLHADEPANQFVVTSLMLLGERLSLERWRAELERRLPALPRFSQRVVEQASPLAAPHWETDPDFELAAHVHRLTLPPPGGAGQLEELLADLMSQPIPLQRPPWQSYLVEDFEHGSAVISRLHHCLGDGPALIEILHSLTDEGNPRRPPEPNGSSGAPGVMDLMRAAGGAAGLLRSPTRLGGLLRTGLDSAATLARLSLLDPDPVTPLRGRQGPLKRAAWSRPLSLAAARRVGRRTGTTVNDVLTSVIAGGLGEHLRGRGVPTAGLRLRAMVPVNLRPRTGPVAPGNVFSLVLLELPVGVGHPLERLMRVKLEMDRIKGSAEAGVGWAVVRGMGLLPAAIGQPLSRFYANKATLVLTNVPGPAQTLHLAGTPIRRMAFWEPESGGLGVGISIFSYAGEVTVGAITDARLIERPADLVAAFERAFAALAATCGVRPA